MQGKDHRSKKTIPSRSWLPISKGIFVTCVPVIIAFESDMVHVPNIQMTVQVCKRLDDDLTTYQDLVCKHLWICGI